MIRRRSLDGPDRPVADPGSAAGAVPEARRPVAFHHGADRHVEVFARSTDTARGVLFIDDMIRLRRLGSGFVRPNDLIQVMATLGYRVTVYPINPTRSSLATIYADMPDTVEVMHDRSREELADFVAARRGYYNTIWIARTHNLERVRPMLERATTGTVKPPRIVLDTEAIVTLREAGHASLVDAAPFDVDAAIMQESRARMSARASSR
jgi:hypothetical protein